MTNNPFKKGSTQHQDFATMQDLQWHCTKCELKSGQAKTWQVWRQEKGIQLDTDEHGNFYKRIFCKRCANETIHRKLASLEILLEHKSRAGISAKLAKKIKALYNCEEAIFLRKLSERELEVDHQFPQLRWQTAEESNEQLSDEQLREKFILLTRSHNLLKSRYCENCVKTSNRGSFPGIKFWAQGDEKWRGKNQFDQQGCVGCFWHNPYFWREKLNAELSKKKQ